MILELRFDVFQLLSFKFCHVCVLFFFLLNAAIALRSPASFLFYWRQNQWQINVLSCRDVAGDTFVSVVVIMCSHHYSSRVARTGIASIRIETLILALPRRIDFRKPLFSPFTQEKKSKKKSWTFLVVKDECACNECKLRTRHYLVFATANWVWRDLFGTVLTTAANITLKTTNVFDLYFVHLIWSMYIELINMTGDLVTKKKFIPVVWLPACHSETLFSPCSISTGRRTGSKSCVIEVGGFMYYVYWWGRMQDFSETSAHNTSNCTATLSEDGYLRYLTSSCLVYEGKETWKAVHMCLRMKVTPQGVK
jgi:hypothetical protein